jgi:hypothetical protein
MRGFLMPGLRTAGEMVELHFHRSRKFLYTRQPLSGDERAVEDDYERREDERFRELVAAG